MSISNASKFAVAAEGQQVIPVLQALILAERVYRTDDGRAIIAGTFNELFLNHEGPLSKVTDESGNSKTIVHGGLPGSPYAYISLTDVCAETELSLQFVSLTENHVIFEQNMTLMETDRLETVEIIAALPLISMMGISRVGTYAFEVVCEGEIIGSHRINVRGQDPIDGAD